MKVLGIDTSTSCGSIGLIENGEVISEYFLNIQVTHSERLLRAIEWVLREARCPIEEIDGWAISLGPGSFTGLRIGVSTVKGLAYGTGKPVAGVSTLHVLACQIAPTSHLICPILDARKREVYTAFFRYEGGQFLKRLSNDQVIPPETLIKKVTEQTIFLGDGTKTYGDFLRHSLPSLANFSPASLHAAHGSMVAKLGSELLQQGDGLNVSTFTPTYIRLSEAEIKWQGPPSD